MFTLSAPQARIATNLAVAYDLYCSALSEDDLSGKTAAQTQDLAQARGVDGHPDDALQFNDEGEVTHVSPGGTLEWRIERGGGVHACIHRPGQTELIHVYLPTQPHDAAPGDLVRLDDTCASILPQHLQTLITFLHALEGLLPDARACRVHLETLLPDARETELREWTQHLGDLSSDPERHLLAARYFLQRFDPSSLHEQDDEGRQRAAALMRELQQQLSEYQTQAQALA